MAEADRIVANFERRILDPKGEAICTQEAKVLPLKPSTLLPSNHAHPCPLTSPHPEGGGSCIPLICLSVGSESYRCPKEQEEEKQKQNKNK